MRGGGTIGKKYHHLAYSKGWFIIVLAMTDSKRQNCTQPGDLVLLVAGDRRWWIIRLEPGKSFQTHRGVLAHDDLIGLPWGSQLATHLGRSLFLLRPSIYDHILGLRRNTQIVYPKEAGYLLMRMNIGPGTRVIEAGTGSGGMTMALAHAVRPDGHVYSYDCRAEMQHLARRNLEQVGLDGVVTFRLRDIGEGFDERDVDALFLDLPDPWNYLSQSWAALAAGGFFGAILPTVNQVAQLLSAFETTHFALPEVEEIMLRPYKATPARLRPMDRMVAHTGFLVLARPVLPKGTAPPES